MVDFNMTVKNLEFFEVVSGHNSSIIDRLNRLEGLQYKLTCSSPSNSYQKDSSLDKEIINYLNNDYRRIYPQFSKAEIDIDYDFAFKIDNHSVVFEVEKANKEKILYVFLKGHIYFKYGISTLGIIAPKNWVHASATVNLYEIAKQRLKLCLKYEMGIEEHLKNIVIIGFHQIYKNQIHDSNTLKEMNIKCKTIFSK